ncbi:hypothetical protein CTAYLR_000515 [Chrysophaeum taylorii]|uniref:Polymorphic outer membrane protein n=1 Tax=Chrysophaeum taylorii TaxID=2483200 RepID=A0AAD7XNE3_9STRA|nr:hypothetical protein CTAYLR_000515 [Chrysophaeum taylorii]
MMIILLLAPLVVAVAAAAAVSSSSSSWKEEIIEGTVMVESTLVFNASFHVVGGGTLDGRWSRRRIIENYGELIIENVTVTRGFSEEDGAGILNFGSLLLRHATVSHCTTPNGYGGGAFNGGELVAENVVFAHNEANKWGGGVHNVGIFAAIRTFIFDNYAQYGDGAGAYNAGRFVANQTIIASNSVGVRWGGGVFNTGVFEATGTKISHNTAFRFGGGVHNAGTFRARGCSIEGNAAATGGGITSSGILDITNSRISGNTASSDGGGLGLLTGGTATLANSTGIENAAGRGGFAYVQNGRVYSAGNVVIKANVATEGAAFYIADRTSGAAVVGYSLKLRGHARATVSVGAGATASLQGLESEGNVAPQGAFLYVNPSATVEISDIVSQNDASIFDGVVFLGVYSTTTLRNATIRGATSTDGSGTVYAAGVTSLALRSVLIVDSFAFSDGSAIFVKKVTKSVEIFDSFVCRASGETSIFLEAANATIRRSELIASATLRATAGSTVVLDDVIVRDGIAAVKIESKSRLFVVNSRFFRNNAGACGGALWVSDASATLLHTTLSQNRAEEGGAACVAASGLLRLENASLLENAAVGDGGALYCAADGTVESSLDTFFASNTAGRNGGAVYAARGSALKPAAAAAAKNSTEKKTYYYVVVANNNVASKGGGGGAYFESGRRSSSVVVIGTNNAAAYGPLRASGVATISALTTTTTTMEAATASAAFVIHIRALDAFNQLVTTATGVVRLSSESIIDGATELRLEAGVAEARVAVVDAPGSTVHITAEYEATTTTTFRVALRECRAGEVTETARCAECPDYEYWDEGTCKACQVGMACDFPSIAPIEHRILRTLVLKEGWWRGAATSTTLYRCPMGDRACRPTAAAGDSICAKGYAGPKCAACEKDYYKSHNKCLECEEAKNHRALVLGAGFLGLVFCVATVFFAFRNTIFFSDATTLKLRKSRIYRVSSVARFKILWSTFQIITSIDAALEIKFPEPVSRVLRALSSFVNFDVSVLPIACVVARYNFYRKLLAATLAPLALIGAILLSSKIKICTSSNHQFPGRAKLAFLASFLVYPMSSSVILAVFRCDHVKHYPSHLVADPGLRCGTPRHEIFKVYGCVMTVLIPVGFPVFYFVVLLKNARRIQPPAKDAYVQRMIRSKDATLDPIRTLFDAFKPRAYAFECFECVRRITLIGVVPFVTSNTYRAGLALVISLFAINVYREVAPFHDDYTNSLASACAWLVFSTYLAGNMLSVNEVVASKYDDNFVVYDLNHLALGTILLALNFGIIGLAVRYGAEDKRRERQIELMLAEMRFKEIEADMDVIELRADILSLRSKYEPYLLFKTVSSSSLLVAPDDDNISAANAAHAAHAHAAADDHRRASIIKSTSRYYRFDACHYPCYVVSLTKLRTLDRLVCHEDALERGILERLTPTSTNPNPALTYFVSHNWESPGGPDNPRNTKLEWLKRVRTHLCLPPTVNEVWIWLDFVSIPQKPSSSSEKDNAVASLCYYVNLCSRFIPLVRDHDVWRDLYGEDISREGQIQTYLGRGWCRLELLAALTPKKFASGDFRPGPRNVRFRYHHDPTSAGTGPLVTSACVRDPRKGQFSIPGDKTAIEPVLAAIALRFAEYARSGSDAWDATLDVLTRPLWLKTLAGVKADAIENPRQHVPEATSRPLRPTPKPPAPAPAAVPPSTRKSIVDPEISNDDVNVVIVTAATELDQSATTTTIYEEEEEEDGGGGDDKEEEPASPRETTYLRTT